MIPIHEILIKEWYEFEGASTYAYAHNEVKALTKYILTNQKFRKIKRIHLIQINCRIRFIQSCQTRRSD